MNIKNQPGFKVDSSAAGYDTRSEQQENVIHHPAMIFKLADPEHDLVELEILFVKDNETAPEGYEPFFTYIGQKKYVIKGYEALTNARGKFYRKIDNVENAGQ